MECKRITVRASLLSTTKDTDMLYASRSLAMLKRNPRQKNGVVKLTLNPPCSTNMSGLTRDSSEGVCQRRKRRFGDFDSNEPGILTNRNGRVITPPSQTSKLNEPNNLTAIPAGTQSPCSMTNPPMSPATRRPPSSLPSAPSSPVSTPSSPLSTANSVPSTTSSAPSTTSSLPPRSESGEKIGEIVCKTCYRALNRASSCCGTYTVALTIRVEDIPEEYRPPIACSGSIRAHFPSFSKANRYRGFLANQMSKQRNLRFLVNYDANKLMPTASKRRKCEGGVDQILNPSEKASYKSPMLLAARVPNSSASLLSDSFRRHPAAASLALSQVVNDIPAKTDGGDYDMYPTIF